MEKELSNITIQKPGEDEFIVTFIGPNRAAAEKELQQFIAGRPYSRYVDHFNPNNQIIRIQAAPPSA